MPWHVPPELGWEASPSLHLFHPKHRSGNSVRVWQVATFLKGHAKVLASGAGAMWLEGDASGSSYMGDGLQGGQGARWPQGPQGALRQPSPQRRQWQFLALGFSQAVAGMYSSFTRGKDTVAAPALCHLSLLTVNVEAIAPRSSQCREPTADHVEQTRMEW